MKRSLLILIICAAAVRLFGITYGLPLWLVGDETSFVFGALKMMELRTIVPSFHHAAFIGVFYYTPYLSYLYLLPFAVVAGVKYILFNGNFSEFAHFLQTDLSNFFITARFMSAAIGTATVYIVYRVGKNIFGRDDAGLAAAFFLGFSFLHVNFSHWARHWVPAAFVFSVVMFCLSHTAWSVKKRYMFASLATGLGMGVTQQVGLIVVFIILWFFLVDRLSFRALLEWWPISCVGIFLAFSAIAYALWPPGFYVVAGAGESIIESQKSLTGLFSGFPFYAANMARGEPVMLLFLLLGTLAGISQKNMRFLAYWLFITAYFIIFYLVFLHVDRFLLMLYPIFAIMSAGGFLLIPNRFRKFTAIIIIAIMLMPVIQYDSLLFKNDTRILATIWSENNIPAGAKVMVLAPLMRLPAISEAISEQEIIDAASLRSADKAERQLPDKFFVKPRYHSINLNTVRSLDFLENIEQYMVSHEYEYVIYEPKLTAERVGNAFDNAGKTVAMFRGYNESYGDSIINGFGDGWAQLWKAGSIGPDIIIKRL